MLYPPSSMIATGITLPLLGVALTGMRFWVRLQHQPTPIGIDDWAILVATVVVVSLGGLQIFDAIRGQLGRNDEVGERANVGWRVNYAQSNIEKLAFGSIKLSILFFYRRIFRRWSDFLRLNTALIILIVVWTVVYLIGELAVCGLHSEVIWEDHEAADKVCMNHGIYSVSFAASDVFTDTLVIGVPFLFTRRIQISARQRWGVVAVFLIGFLSTLAAILRLVFLSVWQQYGQFVWNPPPLTDPPEILNFINPLFFSNLELNLGVMAANLMTFAPLIRKRPSFKQMLCGNRRKSPVGIEPSEQDMKSKSKTSAKTVSIPEPRSIAPKNLV